MSTASLARKIPYHHHHVLRHKPPTVPTREPALLDSELVDKLMVGSIKTICEEVAAKEKIECPVIESVALESLSAAVDEFMLKFLSKVRRSMLIARRTAPIATDFETAIHVLDIPRPDDQLKPYATKPPLNPQLLPTPPPDDTFHNTVNLPTDFLGPELDGHGQLQRFGFNTSVLPALPSAHTFRETPLYPTLEKDTRKIRELATQEGKLGEQALRKLAGAVKLDATHPLESEVVKKNKTTMKTEPEPARRKRWKNAVTLSEEAVFEETLRDLLAKEPGGFELGPIVTCEKAYRMPDDIQVKRRAPLEGTAGSGSGSRRKSAAAGAAAMEL